VLKQFLLRRRKGWLLYEPVQHADGELYLFNIGGTAGAIVNVLFKPLALFWKQSILQILGDQFHDFLAAERIIDRHIQPLLLVLMVA